MRSDGGWLARTGQRWKTGPGVIALVLAMSMLVGLIYASANPETAFAGMGNDSLIVVLALMLALFGTLAFAWFIIAIRCPACGKRPAWQLMAGEQSSQWFTRLWTLEVCPACGYDGRGQSGTWNDSVRRHRSLSWASGRHRTAPAHGRRPWTAILRWSVEDHAWARFT
jgi:hypothetical protein